MAESPRHPDAPGPDRRPPLGPPPGTPRWVKVSGIIVGALILLVVILKVTGLGGEHGPGRHMGAGVQSAGVTAIQAPAIGNWAADAAPQDSH
ncbi:hypothetical protein [Streptomyces sp. NPDC002133]|uniref:hypothetical protein n=1 Tax=Streptomyces sp. NPDC002133 TaxID=3154409 RepID=UPI00332E8459